MSKKEVGASGQTFSFTVTDLEPLPATRVGNPRKSTRGSDSGPHNTAVATPDLVEKALGGRGNEGDDTVVERRRPNTGGEAEVPQLVHESLSGGTLSADSVKDRRVPNKGQTIADRYLIEDSIASGGMGRVYKVKHLHLGKTFALKQMHESFGADESFRAKFYQEARIASGLSHKNIVSIVDFGEDPELGVFMVMELEEGEPLSRRLRNRERLPLRMACEVILQIADALHFIHKEGIVHGDIKPDNILLRRAGKSELRRWNICLLDFGLARSHQSTVVDEEHIEGTPAYMAPEVICGQPLREASDIYSLGILAYQIVTGHAPFQGDFRSLMTQHLKSEPKPIQEMLGEEVDERLEALVMKAMAKDPNDRQSTMAAFLFEMKTLMDMLGFGKRRAKAVFTNQRGTGEDTSLRQTKMAFEYCDAGIALVSRSGEVHEGNHAFSHFFRLEPGEKGKRPSILDPRFLRIHPDLNDDMATVLDEGRSVRRILSFVGQDGAVIELVFALTPVPGESDRIVLSIVPLV